MLGKKRQIRGQRDKGRTMGGGRGEGHEVDEGEDESFVVLMLNELENTIELLWLWKSLWGHRKLAPVWELSCWQKRGFVWWAPSQACSLWDPHSSVIAGSAAWQGAQQFLSNMDELTAFLWLLIFIPPVDLCFSKNSTSFTPFLLHFPAV